MNVLRPIQKEFYGDDNRWFFGTVINANPPAGLEGRVKVRINGVHSPNTTDIPEADLPWAQVLIPTTEGGSSGIGRIPQIVTGAFVFGIFLDGIASQLPLVLGTLPHVEYPSSIQKSKRVSKQNSVNYSEQRLQNIVIERLRDDDKNDASLSLRRQQCLKFFIDNGYSLLHAAAITGALEGSSAFVIYSALSNDKQGIASWSKTIENGIRYQGLIRFASKYQPKADWKLFSVQLQYVLFELRTRYGNANRRLLSSTDLESASRAVNQYYLNSFRNTEGLAQLAYDGALV